MHEYHTFISNGLASTVLTSSTFSAGYSTLASYWGAGLFSSGASFVTLTTSGFFSTATITIFSSAYSSGYLTIMRCIFSFSLLSFAPNSILYTTLLDIGFNLFFLCLFFTDLCVFACGVGK